MRRRLSMLGTIVALLTCAFLVNTGPALALNASSVQSHVAAAEIAVPEGSAQTADCSPQKAANSEAQAESDALFDPLPKIGIDKTCGSNLIKTGLQFFFMVIGALAVLLITIAGFKYIRAAGNPDAVSKAKDTIIYAAVGLAVALTAQAIIVFVFNYLIKA